MDGTTEIKEYTKTAGAFSTKSWGTIIPLASGSAGSFYNKTMYFNASNSNSIYGKSISVQPPALSLIPQIRF